MKRHRIEGSQQPLDFRPWDCTCTVINFHGETHCRACGAPRPEQELVLLTEAQMEQRVAKLQAEGRFPSLEEVLDAIAVVRREYRHQILKAREESEPVE